MERAFYAMGTEWWLRTESRDEALLDRARALVETVEARLSRFRDDSTLSRLNRERAVDDALLAEVLQAAEATRVLTAGAFDARVGAAMAAVGYDHSFEAIGAPARLAGDGRRPDVHIEGTRIMLAGGGSVDLGGIAKGWTIDRVADLLGASGPCMVDGGGDIAVRGQPADADEWLVGVGDGLAVGLSDAAVATSSSLRRRWRCADGAVAHHIIDPGDGLPTRDVQTTVVVASTATLADALATAAVVDPHRALPALAAVGAEALLQHADGRWEMTPRMEHYLR